MATIEKFKRYIKSNPGLFNAVYPTYVRLNLARRRVLKRLFYVGRLSSATATNDEIANLIADAVPAAIGKIGNSELSALHYWVKGKTPDPVLEDHLFVQCGFFPFEPTAVGRFQRYFSDILGDMTHIAVWGNFFEPQAIKQFAPTAGLIDRKALEPHKMDNAWTRALEGKRVVVVSPFSASIQTQYDRRERLWSGRSDMLPGFSLRTVKTPFSPGLQEPQEADWFERLDNVWADIESEDFDVCLVGAGAMSLPLCVMCARAGKVGIHLGGYTQIMFGIWGRRWEHDPTLKPFRNEYWISPLREETPERSHLVDNNSYW